ncbi:hypothetical protein C2G38_2175649 [Gigaspora rosea]|uniref:Uncharacterized protein n=1 Tax=Gigaspora rosea TaxID=44941 RepID=A0A397VH22_9GLOM|nr:hypothetical protein C2G38_2175649 [Gigaspora rosea]
MRHCAVKGSLTFLKISFDIGVTFCFPLQFFISSALSRLWAWRLFLMLRFSYNLLALVSSSLA